MGNLGINDYSVIVDFKLSQRWPRVNKKNLTFQDALKLVEAEKERANGGFAGARVFDDEGHIVTQIYAEETWRLNT